MISLEDLKKVDTKEMHLAYNNWPTFAKISYDEKVEKLDLENIDHLVFAGMGGSGTLGDIMKAIFSKENIHVSITKGYLLPKTVDKDTLIVVTSISGNTKETISILKQANQTDAKIFAFCSGGKVEEFCLENNIRFKKIKLEHSPRASLTRFLFCMLNIFENLIPVPEKDIADAILELCSTNNLISTNNLSSENISLNIANWIKATPIIYYPNGLNAVATRFKNSLQENSKIHVITEEVLETCHNGIVAWDEKSNFQPILIRGIDDHEKTKERWEIMKQFFKSKNIEFLEINSVKGNILTKIINLIYITDFASIYHAVLNKVDPTPVSAIDYVKKRL